MRPREDRFADHSEAAPSSGRYPREWWYALAFYEDETGLAVVNRMDSKSREEMDHDARQLSARHSHRPRFHLDTVHCVMHGENQRAIETVLNAPGPANSTGALRAMGELMARFGKRSKLIESEVF